MIRILILIALAATVLAPVTSFATPSALTDPEDGSQTVVVDPSATETQSQDTAVAEPETEPIRKVVVDITVRIKRDQDDAKSGIDSALATQNAEKIGKLQERVRRLETRKTRVKTLGKQAVAGNKSAKEELKKYLQEWGYMTKADLEKHFDMRYVKVEEYVQFKEEVSVKLEKMKDRLSLLESPPTQPRAQEEKNFPWGWLWLPLVLFLLFVWPGWLRLWLKRWREERVHAT